MLRATLLVLFLFASAVQAAEQPNILWITTEDIGPNIGCYGDPNATTPTLDEFAKRALRYDHCWSNAPVCAPARTTIITGVYPPSLGAEHMRSLVTLPREIKAFPHYLREAGYYCTNNVKEDYNVVIPGKLWDESSNKAHYRNRAKGQPFFAVFNLTVTHESQIRVRPHKAIRDPATIILPPIHPDAPEVRRDWGQYSDKITAMDVQVKKLLADLEADQLQNDTIVFFYGDHGSGMPGYKRVACNRGLQVPFLLHVPNKWKSLAPADYQAGGSTTRLVSFVDLAPTVLSLAGIKAPRHLQGVAFLGEHVGAAHQYLHGFRGRMDERIDLTRSVRDQQYVYVRNYYPHLPLGQHVAYMFETPTTRVWKSQFDAGKLNAAQSAFWQPKGAEELYDLASDPHETRNLIAQPEYQRIVERLRQQQRDQVLRVRDVGLMPEGEMHRRSGSLSPYDYGHRETYHVRRIMEMAELAGSATEADIPQLRKGLEDEDTVIRYWALMGYRMHDGPAFAADASRWEKFLDDENANVRVAASDALAYHGTAKQRQQSLINLLDLSNGNAFGPFVPIAALNALGSYRKDWPATISRAIRDLPDNAPNAAGRNNEYIKRMKGYFAGQE